MAPASAARGRSQATKPQRLASATSSTASSQLKASARASASNARPPKPAAKAGAAASTAPKPKPAPARPPSSVPSEPQPQPAPSPPAEPTPTDDPLQLAAQLYPWLYMTSTLDACFSSADAAAQKDLQTRAEALAVAESDIADARTRFDAERLVDFYDELLSPSIATKAPAIMQSFLTHGDACTRVEAAALDLASKAADVDPEDDDPMGPFNEMIDTLEELQNEAHGIESSILELTSPLPSTLTPPLAESTLETNPPPPDTDPDASAPLAQSAPVHLAPLLVLFKACLPVLRARVANLSMALELVDSAQENVSVALRMESLGLV